MKKFRRGQKIEYVRANGDIREGVIEKVDTHNGKFPDDPTLQIKTKISRLSATQSSWLAIGLKHKKNMV